MTSSTRPPVRTSPTTSLGSWTRSMKCCRAADPDVNQKVAMKSAFAQAREFVRGAARYRDLCYILSKGKALMVQDIAHTSAVCVDQGVWRDAKNVDWDSTAIAVAKL